MAYNFPDGETLSTKYLKESDIIDNFIGNRSFSFGANSNGQIGDNTITNKSSPVQTVAGGINWVLVTSGRYATGAIKTDGRLWLWGKNTYGTMGDNTSASKSSPVQTVSGGTNWRSVSIGWNHSVSTKTDGSLWSWGRNVNGQLGNNASTSLSSPVQTVSGGTNWKSVSAGRDHTGAIKTDSTLWVWGGNANGQLGDNTVTSRSSPIQTVAAGTNWKLVECGNLFTVAIKTDGTLWAWGTNGNGQLANNDTLRTSSPAQTIAGGTNWKSVAAGTAHCSAIKTDGTLWTWGFNLLGQLGDNSRTNRSSPVQTVSGGTNWKLSGSGKYHTGAIKTDGTLWMWGRNNYGQLATNNQTSFSSPVQTIAGGTNWKLISCNEYFTNAITFMDKL